MPSTTGKENTVLRFLGREVIGTWSPIWSSVLMWHSKGWEQRELRLEMKHTEEKGPCITLWEWPDRGGHLNRDKTAWLWAHPDDVKTPAQRPSNWRDTQKIHARRAQSTHFSSITQREAARHALLQEWFSRGVGVWAQNPSLTSWITLGELLTLSVALLSCKLVMMSLFTSSNC